MKKTLFCLGLACYLALLTPALTQDISQPASSSGGGGLTVLSPLVSVPTSISINPTLSSSLGKSIDVTTGSSADVTLTLISAVTAGSGALQWVQKVDSGTKKVVVTDGVTAQAWLSTQYDSVVLRSNGTSWTPYVYSLAPRVDLYATNGSFTWTKPPLARLLTITVVGAGAGGGSGARVAVGVTASGGSAGAAGSGQFVYNRPASQQGATEPVVVGVGGAGGAAQTSDTTAGNVGVAGTVSTFSSGANLLSPLNSTGAGNGGGGAGQVAGNSAIGAGGVGRFGGVSAPASVTGAAGVNANQLVGTELVLGGGSGSGQFAVPASNNGGLPGLAAAWGTTAGTAGIGSTKTNPTAGVGMLTDFGLQLGIGGGGGWANADGTAGAGGVGTGCGAPGGGGGGSNNGNASGAGGNGADGCVLVITSF